MTEKTKVESLEIVTRMIKDKQYYEIKYKEVGKSYYNIGYSSYCLENVLKWKEECFELVGEKETSRDGMTEKLSGARSRYVGGVRDMSKAILIMDMPESCDKCPCFCDYYSDMNCRINHRTINYPYPKDFRQRWCPLKELPDKMNYKDKGFGANMFKAGFNACLDKISKGGGLT